MFSAFEIANFNCPLTSQLAFFCACIDRVLTGPGGHLFLPGRPGFGRRDSVRLVAHMHNIQVFSPPVTANFSAKQFDNELKNVKYILMVKIMIHKFLGNNPSSHKQ